MDFSNKKRFFYAKNEKIKKKSTKKHTKSQFSFLRKKNIGYLSTKNKALCLTQFRSTWRQWLGIKVGMSHRIDAC